MDAWSILILSTVKQYLLIDNVTELEAVVGLIRPIDNGDS